MMMVKIIMKMMMIEITARHFFINLFVVYLIRMNTAMPTRSVKEGETV